MIRVSLHPYSAHNCGAVPHTCVSGMEWKGMDKEWKGFVLSIPSPKRHLSDVPTERRLAMDPTC